MTSEKASLHLAVTTVALIIVVLCGEIKATTGSTIQPDGETSGELAEPRTFGRIRILKNFVLPILLLLGGIKMLLMFLVAVSLKTLFVGMSILIIHISFGLAKVINFFKMHTPEHKGWAFPEKAINIHVHTDPGHHVALEGPPDIHSSVAPLHPYARNDIVAPIHGAASTSHPYPQMYIPGLRNGNPPYPHWSQMARKR
ncbi:uncharacterized protein LOC129768381 [Toxorhynchites rutilus septentrionalis]|uniref:uncharacterized protein LOC129768381 n=1 Tax=Toxorhynchites rutilus septentrionalis TaxID=329112 RepID=UPI0024793DC4|nr:uncharacterized protein LOC129768381 [Toxorhynchites rutilus septentrionalis]